MITVPMCLSCLHCQKEMKCKAFPDGIPKDILTGEQRPDKECNNNIGYVKQASE